MFRLGSSRFFLAVLLGAILGAFVCFPSPGQSNTPNNSVVVRESRDDPGDPLLVPAIRRSFERFVSLDSDGSADTPVASPALDYLRSLDRAAQLALASVLCRTTDPQYQAIAIGILLEHAQEETAARVLARQVLNGQDVSGIGFAVMHGPDPRLGIRLYVKTSRSLLMNIDRAKSFLCMDGFGEPIDKCTKAAIEERLNRIEESINRD